MTPIRRDYRFDLAPERVRDWHAAGPEVTQFFNGLSVFFPVGERFFISSVRQYRDRITDPQLKNAVTAFIGQEALHGREHEAFNDLMTRAGLPAGQLEKVASGLLSLVQKLTPATWQLGVTMALEHYTATFAGRLLEQQDLLESTNPDFHKLWLWHALEETEHKSVAFDVWDATGPEGLREYLIRSSSMVITAALFTALVGAFTVAMVEADGRSASRGGRMIRYRTLVRFLSGPSGFFRGTGRLLADYFRPNFHPWDHDNRKLMSRLAELKPVDVRMPAAA